MTERFVSTASRQHPSIPLHAAGGRDVIGALADLVPIPHRLASYSNKREDPDPQGLTSPPMKSTAACKRNFPPVYAR